MVRVMGGEDDGEGKEGDEEKAVSFLLIAYTYLPRYLSQEHKTWLFAKSLFSYLYRAAAPQKRAGNSILTDQPHEAEKEACCSPATSQTMCIVSLTDPSHSAFSSSTSSALLPRTPLDSENLLLLECLKRTAHPPPFWALSHRVVSILAVSPQALEDSSPHLWDLSIVVPRLHSKLSNQSEFLDNMLLSRYWSSKTRPRSPQSAR